LGENNTFDVDAAVRIKTEVVVDVNCGIRCRGGMERQWKVYQIWIVVSLLFRFKKK
jgi:hypothetical protein